MNNRKLSSALTAADFERHARWRVAGEADDLDAWVEPAAAAPGERDYYLCAARVTLRSGQEHPAFVHFSRMGKVILAGAVTLLVDGKQQEIRASNPAFRFTPQPEDRPFLPFDWQLTEPLPGEPAPRRGSVSANPIARFFKGLKYDSQLSALQRRD